MFSQTAFMSPTDKFLQKRISNLETRILMGVGVWFTGGLARGGGGSGKNVGVALCTALLLVSLR